MSVLGIDLSASPQKLSAYALMNGMGELREVDNFKTTDELLTFLPRYAPSVLYEIHSYASSAVKPSSTRAWQIASRSYAATRTSSAMTVPQIALS